MARKLPWDVGASKSSKETKNEAEGSFASKRRRTEQLRQQIHGVNVDDGDRIGVSQTSKRNASSSPPPAPPEEVYMQEGLDADDGWRLVEDEFEMTARLFTRHLHQAELQRQKKLAKIRNQGAVHAITGQLNEKVNPSAVEALSSRQLQVVKHGKNIVVGNLDAGDRQGSDPWLSDPRLASLMSNKHDKAPSTKIGALKSTSRAAYGYSRGQASPLKRRKYATISVERHDQITKDEASSSELAHSESDDLDGPSFPKKLKANQNDRKTSEAHSVRQESRVTASRKKETASAPRSSNKPSNEKSKTLYTALVVDSSDDDEDPFGMFALRRAQNHEIKTSSKSSVQIRSDKNDDNKTREGPIKEDEIPTFLV